MLLSALVAVVVFGVVAYAVLTMALRRRSHRPTNAPPGTYLWVFVVPALDEAGALRATLDSLLALDDDHTRVLVVDDASDDETAAIAASYTRSRVWLLRRHLPLARKGKGAALNHAYQAIRRNVAEAGVRADRVILGIVDGDGRLAPDVTHVVGPSFTDPSVGAVQVQVRVADRRLGWLARIQDLELLTTTSLTQRPRQDHGSVGLGGNGHFTRLAALESLGTHPWTDCLTEELELGLRLGIAGWQTRFTSATEVAQHAPTSLRSVARQRTRWMQGLLQCWEHVPAVVRSQLPTVTVLDLLLCLATPLLALVASVLYGIPSLLVLAGTAWLLATGSVGGDAWPWLVLAYLLLVGPALALSFLYRHKAGDLSLWRTVAVAHLLVAYSVVWYAAAWRALARTATGRHAPTTPRHTVRPGPTTTTTSTTQVLPDAVTRTARPTPSTGVVDPG
jgi:1,2-diacylglycerol 3-beta-glucosyltransferase